MVFELQNRLIKNYNLKNDLFIFKLKKNIFNKKIAYCNENFKVNHCNIWNLLQRKSSVA